MDSGCLDDGAPSVAHLEPPRPADDVFGLETVLPGRLGLPLLVVATLARLGLEVAEGPADAAALLRSRASLSAESWC